MPNWNFDNSYAKLPHQFYTKQNPTQVIAPKLVVWSNNLADHLGVPMDVDVYAGNRVPPGAEPLAQAYAGHQFGHFTKLGDGRAILLGEQITPAVKRVDIQLKGSGITPYSRGGDGRAALAPMLREYIVSEAMHGLGIPTTRSLAVVETGEQVYREKVLAGAVLTRVAASHIRVGTFEYAAHFCDGDSVRILADYAMARHYPEAKTYLEFLQYVIERQADLIAKWQCVGFIHGVMNTDNMAISGETIDYGPCAFMNVYDPNTVFSSIDTQGRYAYRNQPKMALWNLTRFAETLLPLLHKNEKTAVSLARDALDSFMPIFKTHWLAGMGAKLGFEAIKPDDEILVNDLLDLMQQFEADYTNTFCDIASGNCGGKLFQTLEFKKWHKRWQARVIGQGQVLCDTQMVIPRNHLVEEALSRAEIGDLTAVEELVGVLSNPYSIDFVGEKYTTPPVGTCDYRTFCGT